MDEKIEEAIQELSRRVDAAAIKSSEALDAARVLESIVQGMDQDDSYLQAMSCMHNPSQEILEVLEKWQEVDRTLATITINAHIVELIKHDPELSMNGGERRQLMDYLYFVQLGWKVVPFGEKSYEGKKNNVKHINSMIRKRDHAIAHPITGEPCLLLVLTSRDGMGRYTLENRLTKKRTGSYRSLAELVPVRLVQDAPRVEGVLSVRASQRAGLGLPPRTTTDAGDSLILLKQLESEVKNSESPPKNLRNASKEKPKRRKD